MFRPEFALARLRRPPFLVLGPAGALRACEPESPAAQPTRETLPNGAVLVRYPSLPAIDAVGPEVKEAIVRRGAGPGEIGEANGIFLSGDTLLWIHDHGQGTIIGVDPCGEEVRRFNKPVSSYDIAVVDLSGGFWGAHSGSYRIARTGESGDTLVVIETAVAVQRLTDEDRSAYIEDIVEDTPELRRAADEVAAMLPDVKPLLQDLFVDDQGRLRVERVTPEDAPDFYDLYSQDGDYLGSVRLAFEAAGPIRVQHGSIYSWMVDKFEVPYIVRAPVS